MILLGVIGYDMVRLFGPLFRRRATAPISMGTFLVKYVYNNASGPGVPNLPLTRLRLYLISVDYTFSTFSRLSKSV